MIENTARRDPMLHLLGAMSDGTDTYITDMEAAGQRQLVHSDLLPTRILGGSQAEFEAVGFEFGDPDPSDPMFRPATLPEGWKREGSDHAMWSYLVDGYGRRRVSIFYKAAFYDRSAHMSLNTVGSYLRDMLYEGNTPILDNEWLTREVAVTELAALRDRHLTEAAEADGWAQQGDEYWKAQAATHRQDAAKADSLRTEVASSALWAVHVEGPDDVIAAADLAEADRKAAEINAAWEQFTKRPDASELDPRWHAVVVEWPSSADDHTEEVARGEERWRG
ncbi:hypothetical protein BDK92_7322 [Micromonospora pisi]|uniref:Uncharacterized protein n=1 Tax=Micromonospora pisi TaxID=589240 RepID=A0A495JV16_9ACTN|nr:hypothetical protein [Micromonospora pisi]RKR92840.1 hypothetical protein BDK92_7322 [Micromonospora pisi]